MGIADARGNHSLMQFPDRLCPAMRNAPRVGVISRVRTSANAVRSVLVGHFDRDPCAWRNGQGDILKHRISRRVAHAHVVQFNGAAQMRDLVGGPFKQRLRR